MSNASEHSKRIKYTDLPIDLLGFPLMLIMLSFWDVWVASVLLFVLMAILIFLPVNMRQLKHKAYVFLLFTIQLLGFVISYLLFQPYIESGLWKQVVWISSYLVIHVLGMLTTPTLRCVLLPRANCCCDQRRNEIITAEYIRFDKVLTKFCLKVLCVYVPLVHLLDIGRQYERHLALLLAVLALFIIAFELFQLSWLRRRLAEEAWIPILDAEEKVIGRVPLSKVHEASGTIPRVRLLVISGEMIYLEQLDGQGMLHYDTPFSQWLEEGEQAREVTQRMIDARFCGIKRAKPRALLPYTVEVGENRVLVHLFAVELEDPLLLYINCRPIEGKWWSLDQLKSEHNQTIFGAYLRSEFPLLEETILWAKRLRVSEK